MCKYLLDLELCELKGYKDCPAEVVEFLTKFWNAGLNVPKCPLDKAPKGTTENPWDGFIDNNYNWNADGMQDSNYNPWKGKIVGKRSVDGNGIGSDKNGMGSDKWTKMGSNFDYKNS